jgi:uncharacterized glyoxalase superfamily protein PhnB
MSQASVAVGQTIFPTVRYTDARAAIAWLEQAFGARQHAVYDAEDGTVAHAELIIADNVIMLGNTRDDDSTVRSPKQVNAVTGGIYVVLPNPAAIDALHAQAAAAGAKITRPPFDTDYGSHDFQALDLEGYPWSFGTYTPKASS